MSSKADLRQQRVGGFAALYLAAAFVVAMPYFLVFAKYPSAVGPAAKVAVLVEHHDGMRVMYLVTCVIFGLVLAVLALALHARLKDRAPVLIQAATAVGLIWAVVLVASGMIFNAGVTAVVGLHGAHPAQAVAAWQAIEPVANGLGGSGGELLGGLWVLLVSIADLRVGGFSRALGWFGVVVGAIGLASVIPPLTDLAILFGLVQIGWFGWLGFSVLRPNRGAERVLMAGAQPARRGADRHPRLLRGWSRLRHDGHERLGRRRARVVAQPAGTTRRHRRPARRVTGRARAGRRQGRAATPVGQVGRVRQGSRRLRGPTVARDCGRHPVAASAVGVITGARRLTQPGRR